VIPTGRLVVRRSSKVVQRGVTLVDGRAVIVLRHQPSRAQRYSVSYQGSVATRPSASGTLEITVRRP
jgi:hypothetical protein